MNIEEIKTNERKLFDHVNNRNFKAVDSWINEHVADDFVNHSPVLEVTPDKEGLKKMLRLLTIAFKRIVFDVKEIAVDGNLIFFRLFLHGMGEKPLMSMDSKPAMGMVMVKLNDNGKMTDRWAIVEQ